MKELLDKLKENAEEAERLMDGTLMSEVYTEEAKEALPIQTHNFAVAVNKYLYVNDLYDKLLKKRISMISNFMFYFFREISLYKN